jgi:hypothetical protein
VRVAVLLLSVLLLAGCGRCFNREGIGASQSIARFTAAVPPPVDSGRYPGPLRILSPDHPLAAKAASLRADVECHEQILRQLVRDRISAKAPLEFRFMYVAQDSLNSRLVLRYFARAWDQTDFAGWQVQLVYTLPSLRPERAYVQTLPLE